MQSVTVNQHAYYQDLQAKAAKWNSDIIYFIIDTCASPIDVKMSFVKDACWASKSLKSSFQDSQKCSIFCACILLRSVWVLVKNQGSPTHYFHANSSQLILHEKQKSALWPRSDYCQKKTNNAILADSDNDDQQEKDL